MRNNTALPCILAAAFAALTGCGQQPSPEKAPIPAAPEANAAACAAFAAKRVDSIFPEQPNPETQRALIESLESRLSRAVAADVPALLLEVGRAKARFTPAEKTSEFFYNEIGGDWLYNGHDFRELTRRFPSHDLADDAAYELTLLRQGGECEGWVPCYVSSQWEPLSTFLKAYPDSPLADTAVERALSAFALIETDKDLRAASDFIDPVDVIKLTASLEEVGRALPPARGGRLLLRAAELWEAASNYDRARNAYRAVTPAADPQVRGCAAARLDALSARTFTLHPARVIHPERVELRWDGPASLDTGYAVYRSAAKSETGTVVAQIAPEIRSWVDTTTKPGTTYWYRVSAGTRDGPATSNPASAETPTLTLQVLGIAVSPADKRLHVMGHLGNGFPQVVHVAPDGASMERRNAEFIGVENGTARTPHAPYVDEVWLVDAGSHRALRFQGPGGVLPPRLSSASSVVRQGRDYLQYYPLNRENAGLRLLVSIDEKADAAWITQGGGGLNASTAMDCLAIQSLCWLGGENDLRLRDDSGRVLQTVRIQSMATNVFADPTDASAWVLLGRVGQLLHLGRDGTLLNDMTLVRQTEAFSLRVAADFERRQIWFTRWNTARKNELVRMDLNTRSPVVISDNVPALSHLAPDLTGGLWLVHQQSVTRMDANGRTLFTVQMD